MALTEAQYYGLHDQPDSDWGTPVARGEWCFWPAAPTGDWPSCGLCSDSWPQSFWTPCNGEPEDPRCDEWYGKGNWDWKSFIPPLTKFDYCGSNQQVMEEAGYSPQSNALLPGSHGAPRPSTSSPYPWRQYSQATEALQHTINTALAAHGYCPIKADGKLGPGTCAASRAAGITAPDTCTSFGSPPPRKPNCGGNSSGPDSDSPGKSGLGKTLVYAAVGAVLVGGVAIFVMNRKG